MREREESGRKAGEGRGGGNSGESEGDGKLCETRSSAHKPSYITESHSLSCRASSPPAPSVPRALEMKPNFSLLPRLSHSSLTLQPPPLARTVPFHALPVAPRLAIPYVGE